jgi:quinol monooxygenase YgiN
MIEVVGWIDVEPSVRDELVAASIPFQRSTRDDESGCVAYVFAADPAVPGRIHVYEQWATAEDLDAHFQHPNFSAMRELLRGYPRIGSSTLKHLVERTGPVATPEGTPSATYWPATPSA